MDIFDWEELVAEMLGVTDEQREDDYFLPEAFYTEFDIEFEDAFVLAQELIKHTSPVQAGLSGRNYHAFISRADPVMLMKLEVAKKEVIND